VVGEVVEIDEATEKRETMEFAHFRVKTMVSTAVNMEKEFCINGCPCKVTFVEEVSFTEMCLGKWDGGVSEVDTEASSDEGSLGASLYDFVGSEFGGAEEGGVGVVGEGRMGNEETVQGKLDLDCLGKERQLHEGVAQDQLRGSLNVHDSLSFSKKEKVESLFGHGSLSYSKKEKVESSLNVEVAISKDTKSVDEKAKSDSGVGVIKCSKNPPMGSDSERVGASFHVEGVQGVNDRVPSSLLKECSPLIGCLERGALSGKEEVWAFNDQTALPKSLRTRRDLKNTCFQDGGYEDIVVGLDSEQTGFVSRVEDSLGTRPSMDELEQSGARVGGEGDDGCSRTSLKDHSKTSVIHRLIDNGSADFDKLDDEEEARRSEVPTSRECGRAFPPGGSSAGLGAGLEGGVEGGGNNVSTKGRSAGLAGEVEGKHSIVDQVFLVRQTGSSSNSLFTSDNAIENCNRIF